ncbi:primary-amine oxidase [Saccharopolyspora sp. HNM0983]|uniref:Amine oxidase n=1 Tax=Saccharopolyspora montiporae TaxID=2781240 RepID=A0A929G0P5_9PSEU|nr:primary-amine oxidase [Saccharopolyspora sp. HNM0983]MBE9373838.1 primary-amine oxidase [Saccharopolyspora sp. HNM0983]
MTALGETTTRAGTPLPAHPLEPLTGAEIEAASALVRGDARFAPAARFVYVELAEPGKDDLAAFAPGAAWDRTANALLRDPARGCISEVVVSLSRAAVVGWRDVRGVQAPMTKEEFLACESVVRGDERWIAAMRERGVQDLELAMVDPWAAGYTGEHDDPGVRRLARPLTFVRAGPDDNGYAHPVEGLIVTVDLDEMRVLEVTDHGAVPLPDRPGNYYPELAFTADNVPEFAGQREPLNPIEINQPAGPSFRVEGHAIAWANWRLRIGFTPREGLVLHEVGYVDRGRLRPVLHRASLAEMYVPYGDPGATHHNKNVFDEGEYGVGWLANSLELGCDCLGEIRYFDAVVNDQDGMPTTIGNAICLHEEDASIGWKHTDFRTGRAEVRRNRRLVISFITTVGNYEYGFYWHLYLDGSIEFEVKLTGILSTGALPVGETPDFGTLVAPGLYGPHHEHYFSLRLDMRVDGDRNNLVEVDSVAVPPGPDNPHGNAWRSRQRRLRSESEAQRLPDPLAGRAWLVQSADRTGPLGAPTAYRIEPGPYTAPLWQPDSQQAARGGFATRQLWATPFDPDEYFAAGRYVAQSSGGEGLPAYTAADRDLDDCDLVLWCTLSAHHVVRPEDWPVMPVTAISTRLRPFGFFDGNPMLDLPAETGHCPGDECGEHP